MFFSKSKRKIAYALALSVLLVAGVLATVTANNKWKLVEAFDLRSRSLKENVTYWWKNKVVGRVNTAAIIYSEADNRPAKSIPALVYHGIPDEGHGDNPFNSPNFAEQMKTLKNAGWHTISLEQFYAFMHNDLTLPEKSFLLTFDDGRKDTYYPVDPVLKDLGFKAVMFAITKRSLSPDSSQSTYYLSEYELKEMEKSGRWEVESHGRDSHDWYTIDSKGDIGHYFSNLFWLPNQNRNESEQEFRDRVSYDLSTSKKDLETVLGTKVTAFAFPFSDFGENSINFPKSQQIVLSEVPKNYELAFYQVWHGDIETFNYPDPSQFMIRRIEPPHDMTGPSLLAFMQAGMAKDLPYGAASFGQEWRNDWGNVTAGDALKISATPQSTGGGASLDGSWHWTNYTYTTDVSLAKGSNIVLIARRSDKDNFYGCNFSKGKVYIKKQLNGSPYNVADTDYNISPVGKTLNLGIDVNGQTIKCLVNGQPVISGNLISDKAKNGGIGMEVWDPVNGVASATFDNVSIYAD